MSILSKEAIAESEIILNKTNLALARSRKLIQSWITAPRVEAEEEDEDDFKPESETAGIGSAAGDKEDGSAIASLARSRKTANEKLLEQLLGKKAAQAHKKAQLKGAKPLPVAMQQANRIQASPRVDEDDNEESRTSALKQTKTRPKPGATVDHNASKTISSKRKAGSYLDELLSKKARKRARGTG